MEVAAVVPLSWEACCEFCVLSCVEDAVGGLGFGAPVAVVGGVDMPFGMLSAAGEAILGCSLKGRRGWLVGVFDVREQLQARSDLRARKSWQHSAGARGYYQSNVKVNAQLVKVFTLMTASD